MEKNILIPSDFSICSLCLVKEVIDKEDGRVNIFLIHGIGKPSGFFKRIFFSEHQLLKDLLNDSFIDACEILKNKHASKINSIQPIVLMDNDEEIFMSKVHELQIDEVFLPENTDYELIRPTSFDLRPLLQKLNLPQREIAVNIDVTKKGLEQLFFA